MRDVDKKDLVVALKSAWEEMKDKVLGNLSERVRTFITEEMEFQGLMRLSEVEEEEQGEITIIRGDTDDQFV